MDAALLRNLFVSFTTEIRRITMKTITLRIQDKVIRIHAGATMKEEMRKLIERLENGNETNDLRGGGCRSSRIKVGA